MLSPTLSTWSFANIGKAERDENSEQKGNKGRCLLEWLRSVSTLHRGKQDQCHCQDFLIYSCCCCGTTGDTHSSSNYCHLFRGIVLGHVSPSMSRCSHHPRGFNSVFQNWWMPSCDISAITEQARLTARWILSASTEVMVLTETPCLSDTGQWVTYSPLLLKAWRQETDITHRVESDVVWNAVSHQSVSKCDSTNSNCFHSEGSAGLARCEHLCIQVCCINNFSCNLYMYAGLRVYACLNHMAVY